MGKRQVKLQKTTNGFVYSSDSIDYVSIGNFVLLFVFHEQSRGILGGNGAFLLHRKGELPPG